MVSYKKKSMRIALTLVSGCALRISRSINSTHQMLHAVSMVNGLAQCVEQTRATLTSELRFPPASALDHLLSSDHGIERRAVVQAAHVVQNLWDAVVGKHGDLVNVLEGAVALAAEAGPKVGDQDLRALEEANRLPPAIELDFVPEAAKVPGQDVDEPGRGALGLGYQLDEAAVVILPLLVRRVQRSRAGLLTSYMT